MASGPHSEHVVHFYDRDDDLYSTVAAFLIDGLRAGERVLVMATSAHWALIRERAGLAVSLDTIDAALAGGTLVLQDADALLRAITVDGPADRERFRALVGAALAPLAPPVRVFGEVVALLAACGDVDSAMAIEALGHELAHQHNMRVLCAYDLRRLAGSAPARLAAAHDRVSPRGAATGPLILLADDYEDARELYREFLQTKGYRVVTAVDGIDAVEAARAHIPAAILLDIRMPRMTGLEAMQILKADPKLAGVPIVALTAHAFASERDLFITRGFDAVIAKPCLPEELAETIETLLPSPASSPR